MRTIGVEEELLVVDLSSGYPTPRFDELAAAVHSGRGANDLVEQEFKLEQAEIASAPHREVGAVLADLSARRSALTEVARPDGLGVAALGSSPLPVDSTPTQDDRYAPMHAEFGLLAAHQLTCGAHVHVSVESAAESVAVLDRIRPWLAVLIALCANSPYWDGEDSGYASYRSMVWGQWPTAGPTGTFGDEHGYRRTIDELIGRAARSGSTGDLVDLVEDGTPKARSAVDVVDHLLDLIGPALGDTGDEGVARDGLDRIFRRGTGADHQRAVGVATGDVRSVVLDAVRATDPAG